jgi:hypothetical protein
MVLDSRGGEMGGKKSLFGSNEWIMFWIVWDKLIEFSWVGNSLM